MLNERIPTPAILGPVVHLKLGALPMMRSMSRWEATFCEAHSPKLLWWNSVLDVETDFVVVHPKSKAKTGAGWGSMLMLDTAGVAHTFKIYLFDDDMNDAYICFKRSKNYFEKKTI